MNPIDKPITVYPKQKIDRGLSYACGGFPDSQYGCGLFFCEKHMHGYEDEDGEYHQACDICTYNGELGSDHLQEFKKNYSRKPDHPEWIRWKLKDKSWSIWRAENPDEVKSMKKALKK